MGDRTYDTRTLAIIVVLFVAIFAVDVYVLPGHFLASSLYAIPILIAAYNLPPRAVGIISVISLFLSMVTVFLKNTPTTVWPYSMLALAIIAYLGVFLSREFQETSQRAAEAEEARRRLQEFTGMVAHDLRGPLAIILGYVQVLRKGREAVPADVSSNAIRTIEGEARRMNRLINDLLDAAAIGAGRFAIEREFVDLVKLAKQVMEEQQSTTTRHSIVLEAPASLEGRWDGDRIAQVLINLIANAIQPSPHLLEVKVVVARVDNDAIVSVKDQGFGLAPEDIPLLFEPFSRPYREQPVKGTGLGLYISKAIIEAHGGRIWAESQGPGKGSTFTFTLPLSESTSRTE
ncbi:MAG: HAMP domain-containing histidine kinase [Chloroflexi bacterium]|nr:HAMP domain-containing histidine kinase [Chloroflexota bacterium]